MFVICIFSFYLEKSYWKKFNKKNFTNMNLLTIYEKIVVVMKYEQYSWIAGKS